MNPWIRKRLTYANAVATLALFLALSGTTVAAVSKLNGSKIVNGSIPGKKLKRHTVTAHEINGAQLTVANAKHSITADNVAHLVFSHSRQHAGARAADASQPTTITTMSLGQTAPVLQAGPYTVTAKCGPLTGYGDNDHWFELDATSSADNWYADDVQSGLAKYGPYDAGQVVTIYKNNFSHYLLGLPPEIALMSADGSTMDIGGNIAWGEIGDCSFSLYVVTSG